MTHQLKSKTHNLLKIIIKMKRGYLHSIGPSFQSNPKIKFDIKSNNFMLYLMGFSIKLKISILDWKKETKKNWERKIKKQEYQF